MNLQIRRRGNCGALNVNSDPSPFGISDLERPLGSVREAGGLRDKGPFAGWLARCRHASHRDVAAQTSDKLAGTAVARPGLLVAPAGARRSG